VVTVLDPSVEPDRVEALIARLDDPQVASSLNALLDHVDLLVLLVEGLDGLLRRGDTITDSLTQGVEDLRGLEGGAAVPTAGQVVELTQGLTRLTPTLVDLLPTIEQLLRSDLGDPRVIEIAGMGGRALTRGAQQAEAQQPRVSGVLALMKVLKDDDVARGLGFLVSVAKAFGQELKATNPA
jgi:hypothetical protein